MVIVISSPPSITQHTSIVFIQQTLEGRFAPLQRIRLGMKKHGSNNSTTSYASEDCQVNVTQPLNRVVEAFSRIF